MHYIFYYLTEDPLNTKEYNEVKYLSYSGRVVVLTRGGEYSYSEGGKVKHISLPSQSSLMTKFYSIWTKVCFLFARPSNSLMDKGFPSRNIYSGHPAVRWLINRLWSIKYHRFINKLLPTYEILYFYPFKIVRFFVRDKHRSQGRYKRIFVHDALILRMTKFTHIILMAKRSGFRTIANVKSWDNPFYTQIISDANGYLTWSESMWQDIMRSNRLNTTVHHNWGPRPFLQFSKTLHVKGKYPAYELDVLTIGYAAAYCDPLMAAHEVQLIAGIADAFRVSRTNIKILFRPYPTMDFGIYETLLNCPNIEIVSITGPLLDRKGDGTELIRFGSDLERVSYLSRCRLFLSVATSFTLEAAIYGLPIIQYYVPKASRNSVQDNMIFDRIDISDHLCCYFLRFLPIARNIDELLSKINMIMANIEMPTPPQELMDAIGFPRMQSNWNKGSRNFINEMQLAKEL